MRCDAAFIPYRISQSQYTTTCSHCGPFGCVLNNVVWSQPLAKYLKKELLLASRQDKLRKLSFIGATEILRSIQHDDLDGRHEDNYYIRSRATDLLTATSVQAWSLANRLLSMSTQHIELKAGITADIMIHQKSSEGRLRGTKAHRSKYPYNAFRL